MLSVDGQLITPTVVHSGALTTLSWTPTGLQLPRTVHRASLTYKDTGGRQHTSDWNFHLLRNYVLPAALDFEDFESTAAGPDPTVPSGWVQQNFTGHQTAGDNPADLDSDFYLGWVVVDTSFNIVKGSGQYRRYQNHEHALR